MNTKKKLKLSLLTFGLVTFLILLSNKAYGNNYIPDNTLKYHSCNNTLTVKVQTYMNCSGTCNGESDHLQKWDLQYKAEDGTWKTIILPNF